MNKKEIYRNTDSSKNVSCLSGTMVNMRVLVAEDPLSNIAPDTLRAFFDVVIAVGEQAADMIESPDIVIFSRASPHVGGVPDTSLYSKYNNTILCVNNSELKILRALRVLHDAYVLSWAPSQVGISAYPGVSGGVTHALSAADPGTHLAMLGGAHDIFSKSMLGDKYTERINVLINEKEGYIPKHILRPQRPNFIDEVIFKDI